MMPKKIRAKYPGRCAVCGLRFDKGEEIYWFRAYGVAHTVCYSLEDFNQMMRMIDMFSDWRRGKLEPKFDKK